MIFEIQISDTEFTKKHMLKLIKVELRYMKISVIIKKEMTLKIDLLFNDSYSLYD
jgi:hypothetical protein